MPLYLLPNVFDDTQSPLYLLPQGLPTIVLSLTGLIAESERTGRRYLLKLLPGSPIARQLPITLLNEHSSTSDYERIVTAISNGETWGLISDAGMPGIADPGSELVTQLRKRGVTAIRVLPGPSSIFLALIASGLDGQRFSFQGYVPRDPNERRKVLQELERESAHNGVTQICIETPYRNEAFLADCLAVFQPTTELCLACRMTYEDETVERFTVSEWKHRSATDRPEPTVFLFRALSENSHLKSRRSSSIRK
jgi:16S rRNA (cytidine1402-2'-O)-methyltransferase